MTRGPWRSMLPFGIAGGACIAAGGLVSAVTALSPSEQSAWAVAYLVLVAGLAQTLLGLGRVLLVDTAPSGRRIAVECVLFNVANAAVLVGTLVPVTALLYAGAVLLVADLALLVRGEARDGHRHGAVPRWSPYAYRALAALLAVSVPVGLALEALRPN